MLDPSSDLDINGVVAVSSWPLGGKTEPVLIVSLKLGAGLLTRVTWDVIAFSPRGQKKAELHPR
jgi:hypothetical protein